MGRAPCCDKTKVKRGPWSPEEDATLISYLETHGTGGNWIALPQKAGLKRCGKSCRLRWLNYLRPDIKHGNFTEDEDEIICTLYTQMGSRWSLIASNLPGRTDNDVKNYWNTKLKKKLLAGRVNLTNKISSNKFPESNPHLLDSSSTPSTYDHHLHFSASQPQIYSSPFPVLSDMVYGATANTQNFPSSNPTHLQVSVVSEFGTNNLTNSSSPLFTSSREGSSSVSAESSSLAMDNNKSLSGLAGNINGGTSSAVEEGGIMMDFGFGTAAPYNEFINNGLWFQEKASTNDAAALSYFYPNLGTSPSYADIKPQGLNQSVLNQYY